MYTYRVGGLDYSTKVSKKAVNNCRNVAWEGSNDSPNVGHVTHAVAVASLTLATHGTLQKS